MLSGMANAAVPTASCSLNRTTGVAPLSIHRDCSASTDDGTSLPFHELLYETSWGDPDSGVWGDQTTGASGVAATPRNYSVGPIAAHVYETAGTYSIVTKVCDATGCSTDTDSVTVTDPDTVFSTTNTICFNASGSDWTGCPSGATQVTQASFSTAANTYLGTGKRLLFKRGDTFTASTNANISMDGPGIIGAFGSGAAPVITAASAIAGFIRMGSSSSVGYDDWRVMDLELDGASYSDVDGVYSAGEFFGVLLLRLHIKNTATGVNAGPAILDYYGRSINEDWVVQDSTISGCTGCNADWRVYLASKRMAVQGNHLDNETTKGTHVLRSEYTNKSVIAHNYIANAASGLHCMKIHAGLWTTDNSIGPSEYSEQIIISDNKIVGSASAWIVSFGPQNAQRDERVRDIIFERNWVRATTSSNQIGVESSAASSTYRNNLGDMSSAASGAICLQVGQRGVEASPTYLWYYNNTCYRADSGNSGGISFGTVDYVTAKNNLMYTPSASGSEMFYGETGVANFTQSNNRSDADTDVTPSFDSASAGAAPTGFRIGTGSDSVNAGTAVFPASAHDFYGCKDKAGNVRLGAFVPKANARCKSGK